MSADRSGFEFENTDDIDLPYRSVREELSNAADRVIEEDSLVRTVDTVLGMALREMDGDNEMTLWNELANGNYGVDREKVTNEEGLLKFTLEYEDNSNITVGTSIENQEDGYHANVEYIKSDEIEITDTYEIKPR